MRKPAIPAHHLEQISQYRMDRKLVPGPSSAPPYHKLAAIGKRAIDNNKAIFDAMTDDERQKNQTTAFVWLSEDVINATTKGDMDKLLVHEKFPVIHHPHLSQTVEILRVALQESDVSGKITKDHFAAYREMKDAMSEVLPYNRLNGMDRAEHTDLTNAFHVYLFRHLSERRAIINIIRDRKITSFVEISRLLQEYEQNPMLGNGAL